jgi:hypothetical protein
VLERGRWYNSVKISKVTKKKPTLKRPSEQALVKLIIDIPERVLRPREVRVQIAAEHISQAVVTAKSEAPS